MRWRRVIGLALLAAGSAHPAVAQSPTFRSTTDVVQIDVAVLGREGRPIEGLTAADFDLRDNGVPQQVRAVGFDEVPLNLVLVLDTSHRVGGELLERLRRAASVVTRRLDPRDAAAVVTFGARIALVSGFTSDFAALAGRIERIEGAAGETALLDAIYAALVLGDERAGRPVVMVFSDGVDIGSNLSREQLREAVARTRGVIHAVATGADRRTTTLDDLCRASGGQLVALVEGDDPGATFTRVLAQARRRYLLTYSPSDVVRAGWHEVAVAVPSVPDATIQARPGYVVTP